MRIPGQTPVEIREDFVPKAKKQKVSKVVSKDIPSQIPIERQKRQSNQKKIPQDDTTTYGRRRKRSSYAERTWDPNFSLIPLKVDATPSQNCPLCGKKLSNNSKMTEHISNHRQSILASNNIDEIVSIFVHHVLSSLTF